MKKSKRKWFILTGVLLVLVVVLAVVLFGGIEEDPEAQEGTYENGVGPGLTESLQEAAEESMFRILLNTQPTFHPETLEGDVMIINSSDNREDMQVVITLKDSGAEVYESPVISPGQNVAYGTLSTKLEAGSYPAIAYVYAVSPETGERLGTVENEIVLTVGVSQTGGESPEGAAGEGTPEEPGGAPAEPAGAAEEAGGPGAPAEAGEAAATDEDAGVEEAKEGDEE